MQSVLNLITSQKKQVLSFIRNYHPNMKDVQWDTQSFGIRKAHADSFNVSLVRPRKIPYAQKKCTFENSYVQSCVLVKESLLLIKECSVSNVTVHGVKDLFYSIHTLVGLVLQLALEAHTKCRPRIYFAHLSLKLT